MYVKEKVFFKEGDLTNYIAIFEDLKVQGHIIADSFYEDKWTLPCETMNSFFTLNFELGIYKELKLSQKIYFLILIRKGKSVVFIKEYQRKLTDVIFETAGLKDISSLENYILNDKVKYTTARNIMKFIEFYTNVNKEAITNICQKICEAERKNKELPPFNEILFFDEIVNEYFNSGKTNKFKYRSIQLWWAITNIIPMRPVDLLRLKTNCVNKDSRGQYWLTVTRSKKVKESVHDTLPTRDIQVNEDIFRLINEFKRELKEAGIQSPYLLSQTYYQIMNVSVNKRGPKVVVDRMNIAQLRNTLVKFYQEVVYEQYGEDISFKILPSHTRHFAIINLFLQGFNLLSIAELAGHNNLLSPNNYYSHAKSFVESYVYTLNKSGLTNNIKRKFNDGFIGWRREIIDESKVYKDIDAESLFLKVDYGYCKDKSGFPNNCCEDCRVCRPYFLFKPSINDYEAGLKWLEEYSNELVNDINNIVNSMIATSKAISSHYKPDLNESFKAQSRQLQQYMDHKIAIEQKMLEDHLYE